MIIYHLNPTMSCHKIEKSAS